MGASASTPFVSKPSGFLYLDNPQNNLVDMALTVVELDTIQANFTDGIEDVVNHRILPGVAGFYLIYGTVVFVNVVANKRYDLMLYLNGAVMPSFNSCQSSLADTISQTALTIRYLSNTDYMDLRVRSRAGVDTVDIWEGVGYTYLIVHRLRM